MVSGLLGIIILPIFLIYYFVFARKHQAAQMAAASQNYAHFDSVLLAQRMGLTITDGPPGFNLMMAYSTHGQKDYAPTGGSVGKFLGEGEKETRFRMVGNPWGHPMEFVYFYHTEIDAGIGSRTIKTSFECRLSAKVNASFPSFEFILRNPHAGLAATPKLALPPQSFGHPALDAVFILMAQDPRVGPVIGPAAMHLVKANYVHVQGHDGYIHVLSTRDGSSMAMFYIELFQRVIETMAYGLEGRPSPSLPPLPPYLAQALSV